MNQGYRVGSTLASWRLVMMKVKEGESACLGLVLQPSEAAWKRSNNNERYQYIKGYNEQYFIKHALEEYFNLHNNPTRSLQLPHYNFHNFIDEEIPHNEYAVRPEFECRQQIRAQILMCSTVSQALCFILSTVNSMPFLGLVGK